MKYSPVCTVIKNLTNNRRQFFIDRGFSLTLTPAGTPRSEVTLIGDAFSRDPNGDADYALLLAMKNGDIEISYKVDYLFTTVSETEKPAMSCDAQGVREWYLSKFAEGKSNNKTAERVESDSSVKPAKPAPAPAPAPAEPKPEELKKAEPEKNEEEPKQATQTTEPPTDTKTESAADSKIPAPAVTENTPAEPAPASKKSGRRIKVS